MPDNDSEPIARASATEYTIRVEGVLDQTWSIWFDGMRISRGPGETTDISGPVADQAALHGVIRKIRDLGVCLISLQRRNQ